MTENLMHRIFQALQQARRVLLVAHQKPDGDTLGASSSVLNWLIREGKDVTIFCADPPPPAFRYIDNIHRFTNNPNIFDAAYDVVVVFDSGDLTYCGVNTFVPRLKPGYLLINIDHHATNKQFGMINLVLTDASSTAEIVYRFFEANKIWIDDRMATSLLTGLLTDTMHFSNAATNPKSLEASGKLLAAGARWQDLSKNLLQNKTLDALKIWGLLLSRLHHNKTLDIVSTYVLADDLKDISPDVVEGVSNFLNGVTGDVETILTLRELPDGTVKGSMRSVHRDISKIAKLFGGGGHKKAAGFTVAGHLEETPNGVRIVA